MNKNNNAIYYNLQVYIEIRSNFKNNLYLRFLIHYIYLIIINILDFENAILNLSLSLSAPRCHVEEYPNV